MDYDQQAGRLQPADLRMCPANVTAHITGPQRRNKIAGEPSLCCIFHISSPQEIHLSGSGEPGIYMQDKTINYIL
jgi:hypothetical protein